jgi:hypothetical protein
MALNLNQWAAQLSDPKKCLALFNTYVASNHKDQVRQMIQQGFCPDLSQTDDATMDARKNMIAVFGPECLDWCNQLNLDRNAMTETINKNPTMQGSPGDRLMMIADGVYGNITFKDFVGLIDKSWFSNEAQTKFMKCLPQILDQFNVDANIFLDELLDIDSHAMYASPLRDNCVRYCLDTGASIDHHVDKFMNIYGPRMCTFLANGNPVRHSSEWRLLMYLIDIAKEHINVQQIFEIFLDMKLEPSDNSSNLYILCTFIKHGLDVSIQRINDYIYDILSVTDFYDQTTLDIDDAEMFFKALINGTNRKSEYFIFVLKWIEFQHNSDDEIPWIGDLEVDLVEIVTKYLDGEFECNQCSMCAFIFPLVGL